MNERVVEANRWARDAEEERAEAKEKLICIATAVDNDDWDDWRGDLMSACLHVIELDVRVMCFRAMAAKEAHRSMDSAE